MLNDFTKKNLITLERATKHWFSERSFEYWDDCEKQLLEKIQSMITNYPESAGRKMNKREAAIITAYTGILLGSPSVFHKYVEEKFGHSIMTHEMADRVFWDKLKELCLVDFVALNMGITDE